MCQQLLIEKINSVNTYEWACVYACVCKLADLSLKVQITSHSQSLMPIQVRNARKEYECVYVSAHVCGYVCVTVYRPFASFFIYLPQPREDKRKAIIIIAGDMQGTNWSNNVR